MTTINPLSITDAESPHIEGGLSLDQLAELRREVLALGESPATANGLCGWLVTKAAGHEDDASADTRARYRKILRQLEGASPTRGKSRSKKQGGYVLPAAMAAVATMGATAVAAPHSASGAIVSLAVGLYVTRTGSDELLGEGTGAAGGGEVVDICAQLVQGRAPVVLAACA